MLNDHQLVRGNSQYLRLPITRLIKKKAWEQAQNHSNAIAHHNAYINYVSLYTMIDWFTDDEAEETFQEIKVKPTIYPSEESLPSIWEVVNGAAIHLGEKKIVMIPDETDNLAEFSVPQEWIDIPDWAGDYYLAIQVNLEPEEDECWIKVLGFTSHIYLKRLGKYNRQNRTYTIGIEELTLDIIAIDLIPYLQTQAKIPDLPKLSASQAQNILDFCSNSAIYYPRLQVSDLSFEHWATLLVDGNWREEMYQGRMRKSISSPVMLDLQVAKDIMISTSMTFRESLESIKNELAKLCQYVVECKSQTGELIPGYKNSPAPAVIGYKGTNFVTIELPETTQEIALTVALLPVESQWDLMDVLVQVRPVEIQQTLLPRLEIKALNSHQGVIIAAQSEEKDPFIVCKFSRQIQETFSVNLKLDNWKYQQVYSSINDSPYLI